MPKPQSTEDRPEVKAYPAEKARQGQIVLNTPLRRAIFSGLIAFVLLSLGLMLS